MNHFEPRKGNKNIQNQVFASVPLPDSPSRQYTTICTVDSSAVPSQSGPLVLGRSQVRDLQSVSCQNFNNNTQSKGHEYQQNCTPNILMPHCKQWKQHRISSRVGMENKICRRETHKPPQQRGLNATLTLKKPLYKERKVSPQLNISTKYRSRY